MRMIIREFFQDAKAGAVEFLSVYRILPRKKRAIINLTLAGWFVIYSIFSHEAYQSGHSHGLAEAVAALPRVSERAAALIRNECAGRWGEVDCMYFQPIRIEDERVR